jgi:hypothetical protein
VIYTLEKDGVGKKWLVVKGAEATKLEDFVFLGYLTTFSQ